MYNYAHFTYNAFLTETTHGGVVFMTSAWKVSSYDSAGSAHGGWNWILMKINKFVPCQNMYPRIGLGLWQSEPVALKENINLRPSRHD